MKCIETCLDIHSTERALIIYCISFLANLCVYAAASEAVMETGLVLRVYIYNMLYIICIYIIVCVRVPGITGDACIRGER